MDEQFKKSVDFEFSLWIKEQNHCMKKCAIGPKVFRNRFEPEIWQLRTIYAHAIHMRKNWKSDFSYTKPEMHIAVEKGSRSLICNIFDVQKIGSCVNNAMVSIGHLKALKVFHEFTPLIVVVSF